MRIVTSQEFLDRASEFLGSDEAVMVTGDARAVGIFLPWDAAELGEDVRREVFARPHGSITAQRDVRDVSEGEVLVDFASSRRRR